MPEALQEKATRELLNFPTGGEQVSQRRAFDFIQSRYMLSLEGAPFDVTDADLHPEAGACSACPKRTGNQRELFGDVASEDVCTDPDCFAAKKERVWQLRVERAKETGQEVLAAKAAKKVFLYPKELRTACKLFGVNLKSIEVKAAKALKATEQQKAPPDAIPAAEVAAQDA